MSFGMIMSFGVIMIINQNIAKKRNYMVTWIY